MITQIETNYPEGSEIMMTMAEMWMEEGMEKGGAAALSETAIQLLTEKFGKVPLDDILKTDTATLKLLLVNSFKFQDIDEARKYIQ